jgi:predicted DsbA family dithiol-disulfide isomerase
MPIRRVRRPPLNRAELGAYLARVIRAELYSDPVCPWGYSASPALRTIEWRYGGQIEWSLTLIGLAERAEEYEARGFTPLWLSQVLLEFRRYGMPFSSQPKARMTATARACRAVVAARLMQPGSEWPVFRALQLAHFTTPALVDDDAVVAAALRGVPGIDAERIVASLDAPEVSAAYEADKARSREAAGSPAELQGKTAESDGLVRFTAPSVVFRGEDGGELSAGGFQPVEAYDVLLANLDPTLERRPPPETPAPLFARFPEGLTTQEVAALMTSGNDAPDRVAAERALLELVVEGEAVREPLGDDALWLPAVADRRADVAAALPSRHAFRRQERNPV